MHDHLEGFDEEKHYKGQLIIPIILFTVELFGGWYSGSASLLADALHVFMDSLSALISIFVARFVRINGNGNNIRKKGVIISSLLLSIIAIHIIYEGIGRLILPQKVDDSMIGFALFGLVGNMIQKYFHDRAPKEYHNSTHLLHNKHIVSDMKASIGIVIGGFLMTISSVFYRVDGILAIWIGGSICHFLIRLLRNSKKIKEIQDH